ncbi:unnamed protein product [Cylicostephanus goldi]|uniref:Uncharacterized protein n=1 Tax=Cylicostephanus goldi TaxID=71465 RepID=A0A3P6T600_CYLGO|nr:unnamed protein product [Cylicostephanus goldi]
MGTSLAKMIPVESLPTIALLSTTLLHPQLQVLCVLPYYHNQKCVCTERSVSIYMSDAELEYWRKKYSLLEEQFQLQKNRNEELEERLLHMVEKVETEKKQLANEIDTLTRYFHREWMAVRRIKGASEKQ